MKTFENTLLLHLWKGLTPWERERLGLMVHSPIHNQHERVIGLYRYLRDCDAKEQNPDPKAAYSLVFGKKAMNGPALRHVVSYLTKLIEDFLLWQAHKDSRTRDADLLRIYQQRKLNKPFDMMWNQIQRSLESSPLRDGEHHRIQWHALGSRLDMLDPRSPDAHAHIQQNMDQLDLFFLVEKLKSGLAAMSHRKLFKMDYNLGFLQSALAQADYLGYLNLPGIQCYYHAYLTLAEPEVEEHFIRLKASIVESRGTLPPEQERSLLLQAVNYCIGRLNQGQRIYLEHALQLYREGLDSGILLEDGQLSPYAYKNISSIAIHLQQFEWTEQFLEAYSPFLPEPLRESYHTYCTARLQMGQRNFSGVIALLNQVYVKDLFTQLATRVIHIQAAYEQGDMEFVEYQLDNFRHTLHRKELLTSHKKNYGNFVKYARSLMRLSPRDKSGAEALRQVIASTPEMVERQWLLEKVSALS